LVFFVFGYATGAWQEFFLFTSHLYISVWLVF